MDRGTETAPSRGRRGHTGRMRQAYAHDAVIGMAPGGDIRAPGGAITVALCGSLEHEPPCPLAAHHTRAERAGDEVRLRVLFAAEPDDAADVRLGIDRALSAGSFAGPDGVVTEWRLLDSGPAGVTAGERDHAQRLTS
jgi:hypothetical protein